MPTTTAEKIAGINKHPCTPGQLNQTINNITNVLNELNGSGSVLARCTLTNNTADCAPDLLDVSGFTPLVKDFAALGIDTPTQARQYLNIATSGARVGYIVYKFDALEWEVMSIRHSHRIVLMDAPALVGRTIQFPTDTFSVNECGITGQDDVTFTTSAVTVVTDLDKTAGGPITWNETELEVWDVGSSAPQSIATVLATMIREMHKDGCSIKYRDTEVEVFAKDEHASESTAWTYTDLVNLLGDINQDSDGNITGYYTQVYVPCVGSSWEEILLYVEQCTASASA